MNTEEEFAIRLESYEFYLDECIKHEIQVKKISTSLERALEDLNIGLAKRMSKKGLELCERLEILYVKFGKECNSFYSFLESNQIEDDLVEESFALVGGQVKEAQRNIVKALEEHKELFYSILEN